MAKKIKMLKACYVQGEDKPVKAGATLSVDDATARYLVGSKKAEPVDAKAAAADAVKSGKQTR